MIPVSLRLKNFLSYAEEVPPLDFTGFQLACLSGNNGHGKSSLLDAITWALWGEARKVSSDRNPDEGLLRLGASDMEVELEFDLEGDRYRILRKHEKKSKRASSLLDFQVWDQANDKYQSLTESSKTLTQEKIDKTLHMDYETFINSAFLLQGRADEFTKKGARQRKEILANILQLSHYDDLSRLARSHANQIKEELSGLKREIGSKELEAAKKEEYENQLAALSVALEKSKQELERQETALNKIRKEKANLEVQQQREKELVIRLNQLADEGQKNLRQIKEQQAKAAVYAQAIKQAEQINLQYKLYNDTWQQNEKMEDLRHQESVFKEKSLECQRQIEQEKNKLNTELKVAQTDQQRLNQHLAKFPGLKKEQQELQTKLDRYQQSGKQLEELRNQWQKVKESLLKKEHERTALQQIEQESREKYHLLLESQTAECPLCQSGLDAGKKQNLLDQLNNQIKEAKNKIQVLGKELEQGNKQLEQLTQQGTRLKEQVSGIEAVQREMARVTAAIKECEDAQKSLLEVYKTAERIQLCLKNNDYAHERQKELAKLKSAIEKLGYSPQQHAQLRKQLKELKDVSRQWEQLQNAQENWNNTTAMIEQFKERETQIKKHQDEVNAQIQAVKQQLQKLPEIEAQIEWQESDYKKIKQGYEKLIQEQGSYKSKLEYCQKLAREIKQLQKECGQLEYKRSIYDKLYIAFGKDGIQALIIENVIPEIEDEANQILSRLTDNQTQVSIEAIKDKKGGGQQETLDIKICDELGTRSYELYSGGEGFRINFALRIALSKLLARRAGTRLRTLVIDEGFGTQDSEGLEHVIDAIGAISGDFDKIIVVTHLDAIKDAFPVSIKVTKSADLGSSFEIIQ